MDQMRAIRAASPPPLKPGHSLSSPHHARRRWAAPLPQSTAPKGSSGDAPAIRRAAGGLGPAPEQGRRCRPLAPPACRSLLLPTAQLLHCLWGQMADYIEPEVVSPEQLNESEVYCCTGGLDRLGQVGRQIRAASGAAGAA